MVESHYKLFFSEVRTVYFLRFLIKTFKYDSSLTLLACYQPPVYCMAFKFCYNYNINPLFCYLQSERKSQRRNLIKKSSLWSRSQVGSIHPSSASSLILLSHEFKCVQFLWKKIYVMIDGSNPDLCWYQPIRKCAEV